MKTILLPIFSSWAIAHGALARQPVALASEKAPAAAPAAGPLERGLDGAGHHDVFAHGPAHYQHIVAHQQTAW